MMEMQFCRKTGERRSVEQIRRLTALSLFVFLGLHVHVWSNDGINGIGSGCGMNNEAFVLEPVSMKPHVCVQEETGIDEPGCSIGKFQSSIEQQYDNLHQNNPKAMESTRAPLPLDIKQGCLFCQLRTESDRPINSAQPIILETNEPASEEGLSCKISFFQKRIQQIKRLSERWKNRICSEE